MIYLIEDKTSRRNDYGWTDEKLSSMNELITVVENATQLSVLMDEIKEDGNVVLYHESFTQRENQERTDEVKSFLLSLEKSEGIYIAYFSGSKSRRILEGKICNLHFDPLYTNLDVFIKHYNEGIIDFHYIMFGEHPEIEEKLLQLIQKVNDDNIETKKVESTKKILCLRTSQDYIQFPVSNATIDICDYETEDKDFIKFVEKYNNFYYDVIYIPLCLGETLSDYLGLRLAMFFRLCNTVNKYAQIFIYGVVNATAFIKFECAEILKMPRVNYIPADSKSLIKSINDIHRISEESYRLGLKSIHLNVPTNIGDNHSVANKWGRSRWSVALNDTDSNIEKGNTEIENSLYFRYLSALYPPTDIIPIAKDKLKIEKDKQLPALNILYVDDEADEGWYELLRHIICDVNDIKGLDYIGSDLKSKSQEEIISYVMKEIIDKEINLVILDLRLHPDDFDDSLIDNITGYKLLQAIKDHNRGIQVIMFSATNKVWNLQTLLEAEADGFIMKEAPINSADFHFTEDSIISFVNIINKCIKQIFRKDLWSRIQKVNKKIEYHLKFNNIRDKYANNVLTIMSMVEDALFDSNKKHSLDNIFVNLFSIIELTANDWIETKKEKYGPKSYFKGSGDPLFLFDLNNKGTRPIRELLGKLDWGQKIANILYRVDSYDENIVNLVEKRNDFTHPRGKITYFTKDDILSVFKVVENIIFNIEDN